MVPLQSGLVAATQARPEVSSWLVLGARGQLGTCMQEVLADRGLSFVALGSEECDVTSAAEVSAVIAHLRPDVVVNCSAWTAVDAAEDHEAAAFAINCDGPKNIATACRSNGSTLVHISTDYVFPGTGSGAYAEDSPTAPVSVYGKSKLCGEQGAIAGHPDGTYIVRTSWLYSRHGANFVKTMLRRALAGVAVRVVDDQFGQPTLADDLARHIIELVTSKAPVGVYHGTNSGQGTWFDLAKEIFVLSGAGSELVSPVGTSEYPTRAERPANSVLGHARTLNAGVAEMRKWEDALREAIGGIIAAVRSEGNT